MSLTIFAAGRYYRHTAHAATYVSVQLDKIISIIGKNNGSIIKDGVHQIIIPRMRNPQCDVVSKRLEILISENDFIELEKDLKTTYNVYVSRWGFKHNRTLEVGISDFDKNSILWMTVRHEFNMDSSIEINNLIYDKCKNLVLPHNLTLDDVYNSIDNNHTKMSIQTYININDDPNVNPQYLYEEYLLDGWRISVGENILAYDKKTKKFYLQEACIKDNIVSADAIC